VEAWRRSRDKGLSCEGKLRGSKWWKLYCVQDNWVSLMLIETAVLWSLDASLI
jgi:hypothetical protein